MDGDPAQAFAALMSGAAAAAAPPTEAPYGFTTDRDTGEQRPKKAPGRPRKPPPTVEELKATAEGEQPGPGEAAKPAPPGDRAPDEKASRRAPAAGDTGKEPPCPPGRIARGMNRLYRRAGQVIKVFDAATGAAIIEVTRKDDDEDVTVGDAWEEVARTNPRIRRFLLKLIAGGAWGQLAMAHAPIVLALLMKPGVIDHLPFGRLLAAFAEDDGGDSQDAGQGLLDEQAAAARLLDGLTPEDMQHMAGFAQGLMTNFGSRAAAPAPAHKAAA